jgi:hypothetical protein
MPDIIQFVAYSTSLVKSKQDAFQAKWYVPVTII